MRLPAQRHAGLSLACCSLCVCVWPEAAQSPQPLFGFMHLRCCVLLAMTLLLSLIAMQTWSRCCLHSAQLQHMASSCQQCSSASIPACCRMPGGRMAQQRQQQLLVVGHRHSSSSQRCLCSQPLSAYRMPKPGRYASCLPALVCLHAPQHFAAVAAVCWVCLPYAGVHNAGTHRQHV